MAMAFLLAFLILVLIWIRMDRTEEQNETLSRRIEVILPWAVLFVGLPFGVWAWNWACTGIIDDLRAYEQHRIPSLTISRRIFAVYELIGIRGLSILQWSGSGFFVAIWFGKACDLWGTVKKIRKSRPPDFKEKDL